MKHWIRVFLICCVLIGGTAGLAYLSLDRFNRVLDDLVASSLAIATPLRPISSTTSTSDASATSTAETAPTSTVPVEPPTAVAPTTSTATTFSFTFPKQGADVYFGCTYKITFQSSTSIRSLTTDLIDASTTEALEPTATGLTQGNTIGPDAQYLHWKVGVAWPGAYVIRASDINGDTAKAVDSEPFTIKLMPKGLRAEERDKVCKDSKGSLL